MLSIPRARTPVDRRSPTAFVQGAAPSTVVPFDHAARFELTGRPGNVIQDVITVSADGLFVGVAIGYGLDEDRAQPLALLPSGSADSVVPGDITLGDIPASALIEGCRFNPDFERIIFVPDAAPGTRSRGALIDPELNDDALAAGHVRDRGNDNLLLERLKAPHEFSFLFSITDSGTGRELQDEPIHNLASLGNSTGERPFRMLAQPVTFLPRSTVRVQVTERSAGVRGTLFIVFFGYKILAAGCPEPMVRQLRGPSARSTEPSGMPSSRVIPFDYVTTFRLTGRPGNILEDEVSVNVEGGFVATAVGYGLEVETGRVEIEWDHADDITIPALKTIVVGERQAFVAWDALADDDPAKANVPTVDLRSLPLRLLPTGALIDGIRIRPDFVRIALTDGGQLATVAAPLVEDLFERLNAPETVSFRYAVFDGGRGLELQNQPIHNIAGLGAADGSRPFKKLPRPMMCLPRSTIRVRVEEGSGRGMLFIVFQGYKVLGDASRGGRA
jgi:hypothetical protein